MDNYMKSIEYERFGKKTTLCLITTWNGFEVIGKSACVDEKKYDYDLGCQYAYDDARKELEKHLGFYIQCVKDGYPYKTGGQA